MIIVIDLKAEIAGILLSGRAQSHGLIFELGAALEGSLRRVAGKGNDLYLLRRATEETVAEFSVAGNTMQI